VVVGVAGVDADFGGFKARRVKNGLSPCCGIFFFNCLWYKCLFPFEWQNRSKITDISNLPARFWKIVLQKKYEIITQKGITCFFVCCLKSKKQLRKATVGAEILDSKKRNFYFCFNIAGKNFPFLFFFLKINKKNCISKKNRNFCAQNAEQWQKIKKNLKK
jgi:hypothetical protein